MPNGQIKKLYIFEYRNQIRNAFKLVLYVNFESK